MGTGFRMGDNPSFDIIRGKDGRSLAQTWNGSAEAFLGTTISGFPNFFMILGPNSVVYTSQVVTIEAQVEYIVSCILQMDERWHRQYRRPGRRAERVRARDRPPTRHQRMERRRVQ